MAVSAALLPPRVSWVIIEMWLQSVSEDDFRPDFGPVVDIADDGPLAGEPETNNRPQSIEFCASK